MAALARGPTKGGWDDDEEMEDSIVDGEDEVGARKAAASEERERERTGGAEGTTPRPSKRETATERETKKNSPSTSLPPPLPGTLGPRLLSSVA